MNEFFLSEVLIGLEKIVPPGSSGNVTVAVFTER